MKQIVEYALNHELTSVEIDQLNGQLHVLQSEVQLLEKQLHSVVH
jgi:prefoldin subunit 5